MSHVRQQIRDAIIALLELIEGLAGRVVADPAEVHEPDDAPWIEVAIGAEAPRRSTRGKDASPLLQRAVDIFVEIHTTGGREAVNKADEILAQCEAKLFLAGRLEGNLLLQPVDLVLVQPQNPDIVGTKTKRTLRAQWIAPYMTTQANPTATP